MKLYILKQNDIKNVLTMKEAISVMRSAFLQLAKGQAQIPLRTGIKLAANEENMVLFMPGYLLESNQLGIKVASLFPNNKDKHIPTINGVILLVDTQTGQPKALLEAGYLTALRTGAASGLATDLLANSNASTLAIVGSGVQARTQLDAVCCVRNIKKIKLYSRTHENAQKFANEIKLTHPEVTDIKVCETAAEACEDADIICTAVNSLEPVIYHEYVKPDCHINAIGSHTAQMQELSLSIMEAGKIVVDQKSAAIAEAGEIINAMKKQVLRENQLIELGSLVDDKLQSDELKNQLTVFKSVGLAIQDISVAEKALEIARQKNIGNIIEFG